MEYADVMRRMANEGARVIYSGDIAQAIVDTVRGAESNPGVISLTDLRHLQGERTSCCLCPISRASSLWYGATIVWSFNRWSNFRFIRPVSSGFSRQSANYEAYG